MSKFKINDNFWNNYQNIVCDVMLPYQYAILNDSKSENDGTKDLEGYIVHSVNNIEKSHAIENFRIAAGESEGDFYGMVFQDSDVAKWLEAVAYALALKPNPEIEKQADDTIALVGKAQEADGYLNTFYSIKHPDKRWQNLQEDHELYCAGHFIEAGVAYYESTGKTALLEIVKKIADNIYSVFVTGEREGIPGHPEIELALVRLYNVTNDNKYLELASHFVDERGKNPKFYAQEKEGRGGTVTWGMDVNDTDYSQASRPVREEVNAVGHSVRAAYLYTGMAKVALETADKSLVEACERMWDSMVNKQMYIIGGIGSSAAGGECFTADYDLPNDSAYNETCAAISLVFFAKEMLKLTNDSKYADVMERSLYNNILSSIQLDGKRFLYTNPLDFNPDYAEKVPIQKHIKKERPGWHACACCPPNFARMITSLDRYAWHENDNIIYSNLFIGGDFESTSAKIKLVTSYPYESTVTYKVESCKSSTKLAIRLPAWSKNRSLKLNGKDEIKTVEMKNGYAIFDNITSGDEVTLELDISPKKMYASYNINDNLGKCAIVAGPLVYCFEEVDNAGDLNALQISTSSTPEWCEFRGTELGNIKAIRIDGKRLETDKDLYSFEPPKSEPATLTGVPYYLWGNRGQGRMKVWIVER